MMKHFFVGVKAVIIKDGKILLLKDSSRPDFWDVPGGRIDENETIQEALLRELDEELPGIINPRIGNLIDAYRIPGSIKDDMGLVLLFYAVEADFPEKITLSSEHTEYEWLDFEEANARGSDAIQSMLKTLI
jgi:8-oxo-dGTP diphosphatase